MNMENWRGVDNKKQKGIWVEEWERKREVAQIYALS